ncbi:hypothetical protein B0H63DRAFT_455190 [Podospora didyma]|uniref:Heterokaryon incompatibility domain-containing protein n=1 Tax=Podospora didyma TaxID=330526 RepID=A0AAE0N2E7_9PEZI|nr:hypothetical protein B0H63DRAFT_455190 [Podospora didyma]
MWSIYRNAYATICATDASSDNGGCYSTADYRSMNWFPVPIHLRFSSEIPYDTYKLYASDELQWVRVHQGLTRDDAIADIGVLQDYFPLLTRAWIFQEPFLSPQLLHFSYGELTWECAEGLKCQCGYYFEEDAPRKIAQNKNALTRALSAHIPDQGPHSSDVSSNISLIQLWHEIVEHYCHLKRSMEKYIHPALSGIAGLFQALRDDDEYLAGLWRNSLILVQGGSITLTAPLTTATSRSLGKNDKYCLDELSSEYVSDRAVLYDLSGDYDAPMTENDGHDYMGNL